MFSRKIAATVAAVGVCAGALATATAANAVAAATYNVKAGTLATGTALSVTANLSSPTIIDITTGFPIVCPFLNLTGTSKVAAATGVGTAAANVTNAQFDASGNPCKIANLTVTVTQSATTANPWPLKVTDESTNPVPATSATAPVGGQLTKGTLSNIRVTATNGSCTATFGNGTSSGTGSYSGSFANGTGNTSTTRSKINLDYTGTNNGSGALKAYTPTAAGCFGGAIKPGDLIGIRGSLDVNVTSPTNANPLLVNGKS